MPVESQAQRAYLNARFGHAWVKRHGFDQKGKLPEHVAQKGTAEVSAIPTDATVELHHFWTEHPDLRQACIDKYGHDPVNQALAYWRHGLAEPEHVDVLASVEQAGGVFNIGDVKRWERQEVAEAKLEKAGIPAWAHYRPASVAGQDCGTCQFYDDGRCEMFDNAPVQADMVCDKWAGRIDKAETDSRYASHWDDEDLALVGEMTDALEPDFMRKGQGRLYLISHAKTRYNQPGQPHGDRVQGWKNVSLDATGHKQAEALGRHFKDVGLDELHSSDLPRAKQTAQTIGRVAGLKDHPDRKLRPWNLGSFAGHSSADVIPELKPYLTSKSDQPVDGGESFDEFKGRFLPALEKLLKRVDAGKTVGLVTHSRNMELVQGWLGGKGYRTDIDTKAISSDDIDPATVIEVSPGKDGKLQMGEPSVVSKAEAHPVTLHLRVHGVSNAPGGLRVYRMASRDGHYVGRTLPTRVRARKGDVLKVETGDFLQDVQGDMRWVNPNVVSHYSDAPHSWRELSALAGGQLAKDGAEGPAGDIPPAGDLGASSSMPSQQTLSNVGPGGSGPNLSQVHVNVPLPNISVSYVGERRRRRKEDAYDTLRGEFLPVQKTDAWKQLVCGVVLEPNAMDSQDDFMLPHHVEKAAHAYMKRIARGTASVAKLQHREQGFKRNGKGIVPVESFIAPSDFSYDGKEMIKAGSWVMVMHVEDDDLWQDFLDGKYTGFSVGGTGIRRSVQRGDYGPEVEHGYMPQEPSDWHSPLPHPDLFTPVL